MQVISKWQSPGQLRHFAKFQRSSGTATLSLREPGQVTHPFWACFLYTIGKAMPLLAFFLWRHGHLKNDKHCAYFLILLCLSLRLLSPCLPRLLGYFDWANCILRTEIVILKNHKMQKAGRSQVIRAMQWLHLYDMYLMSVYYMLGTRLVGYPRGSRKRAVIGGFLPGSWN